MIFSEITASVSELKRDPMSTVATGNGFPVAIFNRNELVFYCVPVQAYEELMERFEDIELNALADIRLADGKFPIKVLLDDL